MRTVLREIYRFLIGVIVLVVVLVAGFFGYASATEYSPAAVEPVAIDGAAGAPLAAGSSVDVVTFNIGYAGLSADQDFFMDGGTMVQPASPDVIMNNLNGIASTLRANPATFYFIQEADVSSQRSFGIDETQYLHDAIGGQAAYAPNFRSLFTPYPWPPIGRVESGLLTLAQPQVAQAERVALPVPFPWPVRLFNLKRCLLVERVPLSDGTSLVMINVHLEAYDSSGGNSAQTKVLLDFATAEYQKGNHVIIGGDFNQSLPGFSFPQISTNWVPQPFDATLIPSGWTVATDPTVATSRLNDHPYVAGQTQLFGIDGFIVSPNVSVDEVRGIDQGFVYADHNPVHLKATLK